MKSHLFSIVYMFLITLFFASMVSGVKLLNDDRILRNQTVKLQRIVLNVLNIQSDDKMSDEAVIELFETRVKSIDVQDKILYLGYGVDGKTLTGYAIPVGGPGFWGPIAGMVAVEPGANRILGIAFYKHTETPGLGARITEEWFRNQFVGLPLYPVKEGKNIFYLRPEGTGKAANEMDAITGATGTSRAVETFLNQDLDHFIKRIWPSIKAEGKDA